MGSTLMRPSFGCYLALPAPKAM